MIDDFGYLVGKTTRYLNACELSLLKIICLIAESYQLL